MSSSSAKGKGKEVARDSTQSPIPSSPKQPIFYSNRSKAVQWNGICTVFNQNGIVKDGNVRESHLHDAFAKAIRIFNIKGRGENCYLLWQLDEPNKERALITLFKPFLNSEDQEYLYAHSIIFAKVGANEVFVEKMNGGPYEAYMSNMCKGNDIRRGAAFLIAFFGRRNNSPCDSCLNRMSQNYADTPEGQVPVMLPFFECRSLPGFRGGACANCVYHVDAHQCSYAKQFQDLVPKIKKSAAMIGTEPHDMPPPELRLGKHTQATDEISFDDAREREITSGSQGLTRRPARWKGPLIRKDAWE